MLNNVEVFSEEKVYVNTYESLVRELASGMEVDGEKILPKEGDQFDHEDISSWIEAVKPSEDKRPDIVANLSMEKGSKVVSFDTGKLRVLTSEDQALSKEEALYSMALTEAKMKVIRDIAEETYPAVAFQIADYQREMEKVRREIFNVRDANVVMKEIFRKLDRQKTLKLATALVLGSLILAACGQLPTPEPTVGATPFQPQVTETSPVVITPEVSETPFVEVTPTEVVNNEELQNKEEIVKNINEFFNEEGKYSLESFQSQSQYFFGESDLLAGEIPLGLINNVFGQFILLGSDYDGDAKVMHLYLGTLDIDKQRVVFDYNFPRTFEFGPLEPPTFVIEKQSALYNLIGSHSEESDESKLISPDDWKSFFAENQSKPISIRWYMTISDEEMSQFGYGGQAYVLEYDLGRDLRVVIGERLNQLGDVIPNYPSVDVTDDEAESMAACLWSKDSFKGVESINSECPSNHGISNIIERRP